MSVALRSASFSAAPRRSSSTPYPPVRRDSTSDSNQEVLFTHSSARLVAFTTAISSIQNSDDAKVEGTDTFTAQPLPYTSPSERTIASGPIKIYRSRINCAFLQCGSTVQPLLPKSAAWCVDETKSIFVLKIRQSNYWRLEISEVGEEFFEINTFKNVLRSTIIFENTPCPFRIEKSERVYEDQAPLAVFKRRPTISTPTWNLPKANLIEEELIQSPTEINYSIDAKGVSTTHVEQIKEPTERGMDEDLGESQASSIRSSLRGSMSSRGSLSSKNTSMSSRSAGFKRKNVPEHLSNQRRHIRTRTPSIVSFFDNFASDTPLPQSSLRKPHLDNLLDNLLDSPMLSPHQMQSEVTKDEQVNKENISPVSPEDESTCRSASDVPTAKLRSSPRTINITRSVTAPVVITPLSPNRLQDTVPSFQNFIFADIATGRIKNDHKPSAIPRTSGIYVPKRGQRGLVTMTIPVKETHTGCDAGSIDGGDWSRPMTPSTPSLSSAGSDTTMSDWTCLSTPESSNSSVPSSTNVKEKSAKDRAQSYTSNYNERIAAVAARSHKTSTHRRVKTLDAPRDGMNGSVSLTSIAHRTTSLIINKTIDMAVVRPTSYLASLMCSVASKIARGSTVYSYYWAAQDSPEFVDMATMENRPDEFEDDFGVSLMGLRKDKPEFGRRSRSNSVIQDFLLERSG